ncbi:MAG: hypothetical protein K2F79_04085, partial [Muribaculaceae bacterium]|nr:hypothetical protein [Muribaculaceae bacterium]
GIWSDEAMDEIVVWLVSPEHLNFRIFRYNIGGGDDPENKNCTKHHMGNGKGLRAEMEGFKDSSDVPYIWTRDEAQRKIMLKIREKRPDAIFEAFSNSAPYYMTYSGCVAGNTSSSKDNLKPEYYEEFAHYLVDVCKHYKDEYGIEFKTLDPFNEPMTSYWGANGGQEGCHFDVNSQIEFIKVLAPILKESGLSTVISASDETSVAQAVKDVVAFRNAGILDLVGQINTHTYTADDNSRAKLSYLCQQENIPLWMSEVGAGGTGLSGNLGMARKLASDMRFLMPSAWLDWQYIEENNDQWCLVKAQSFESGKYERVKNFYVRSHFSRFIKEGYTILTTLNAQTLAARSPEGDELVLVAFNNGASEVVHNVDLTMYESVGQDISACITDAGRDMADMTDFSLAEGKLTFRLPAESIATFVIPVSAGATPDNVLREGVDYVIAPRIGAGVVLTANAGALTVNNNSMFRSQVWNIAKQGEGYSFTSLNGDVITETEGQYALQTMKETAPRQAFLIDNIDGVHYKIYTDADKAFDLSGEKTADGTSVGVWNYSDTDAPAHRQWLFMSVPEEAISAIKDVAAGQDGDPAPVAVSSPASGSLRVDRISEGTGKLSVYAPSGVCVYSRAMTESSLEIPLAAGCYIVTYVAGGASFATTVAVR